MADKAMDRLIDEGRLRKVMDQRLIKALSHPLRAHLLATLNERIASPTEMAEEIGIDVAFLSYHVRVLKDFGCIELVETGQKRGAIEHFYRAKTALFFDDQEWEQLPASVRSDLVTNLFQGILDDAVGALKAGIFSKGKNSHVSWMPVLLDKQGSEDIHAVLGWTLKRVLAIQAESAERIAKTGERGAPMTIAIAGFETLAGSAPQVRNTSATG